MTYKLQTRLGEILKEKGMTQIALATETNLAPITISKIVRNITSPRLDTLEIILNALELEVHQLIVHKEITNDQKHPENDRRLTIQNRRPIQ